MMTAWKCAAVASVFVFTAGSAAWAQTYTTNPGTQGSYSQGNQGTYTQGYQGNYSSTPGTQGTYNQGYTSGYSANPSTSNPSTSNPSTGQSYSNQGGWNTGMQGTSTPYGGQSYSQSGYGAGNITTYQQAEQELSKYGYSNVHELRSMQGWSADAMKNGERVHVLLGENGLVATFPGR